MPLTLVILRRIGLSLAVGVTLTLIELGAAVLLCHGLQQPINMALLGFVLAGNIAIGAI